MTNSLPRNVCRNNEKQGNKTKQSDEEEEEKGEKKLPRVIQLSPNAITLSLLWLSFVMMHVCSPSLLFEHKSKHEHAKGAVNYFLLLLLFLFAGLVVEREC